jgi:hypothetical protein
MRKPISAVFQYGKKEKPRMTHQEKKTQCYSESHYVFFFSFLRLVFFERSVWRSQGFFSFYRLLLPTIKVKFLNLYFWCRNNSKTMDESLLQRISFLYGFIKGLRHG